MLRVLAISFLLAAGPIPEDTAAALAKLSASLDRLSAAIERQAAAGEDARAGKRVEVAIGILGLRTRKVDRLEAEIRALGNEGEDIRNQLELMKGQMSEVAERAREEGRETSTEERAMREAMEQGQRMAESRIRTLEERKSAMQAELDNELRGLSRLEAMLEDWLKAQP